MPLFTPNANDALFSGFSGITLFGYSDPANDGNPYAQNFFKPIQDEILNLIGILQNGGLGLKVVNDTGVSLPAGPISILGYDSSAKAWKAIKADATGPTPKVAMFVLLTSLANGVSRVVYAQGVVLGTDSSFSTLGSTIGDPVYLALGGGFTLTAPSAINNIVQPVGAVLTVANPGDVQVLIQPIEVPIQGFSGFSGVSGFGQSGYSGKSGTSGVMGVSGFSGADSGYSGQSGVSGDSGTSGFSGFSGWSGLSASGGLGSSGFSGESGFSGQSATSSDGVIQAFMERSHFILQASGFSANSTTPAHFIAAGCSGQYSSFGGNIHSFPDFGNGIMFSAANTSGQNAGWFGVSGVAGPTVLQKWNPMFVHSIWTGNSTNDLQNVRLYIGLKQSFGTVPDSTDTVATLQGIPMVAFRYDSTGGVDTIGYWSAVTCDGSTLNVIPGISPIAVDTAYNLRIDMETLPGTATFYIDDVQVASTNLNLPGANVQLLPICRLTTTSTTQGAVAFKKFHVRFK